MGNSSGSSGSNHGKNNPTGVTTTISPANIFSNSPLSSPSNPNKTTPTKPNTNNYAHANGNGNLTSNFTPNRSKKYEPENMELDLDSPMHMSDWLTSNPSSSPLTSSSSPFDYPDSIFPAFSTNLSFSTDIDLQNKTKPHKKKSNTPSMFTTP
jgi:hypothetical protein